MEQDQMHDPAAEPTSLLRSYPVVLAVALVLLSVAVLLASRRQNKQTDQRLPPHVPHSIPFVGNAIRFGMDPVAFLQDCQKTYGDTFTFTMLGLLARRRMTFCLGDKGNHFVFNARLKEATAEGAYLKLTRPVFGDQVIYDVPNSVFMEQKKFVKDALTTTAFRTYLPILTEEINGMILDEWADNSQFELFPMMAELTIRTASACLMGREIREQLHSNVAKLFHDLDCGLTPLNVFVEYLPLPLFINRDRANRELTELFLDIIKKRNAKAAADLAAGLVPEKKYDVLETLMTSVYKAGEKMGDIAVAHMMIALLMAGQHTSSTTSTWMLFELAGNPDVVQRLRQEQSQIRAPADLPNAPPSQYAPFTLESLKSCTLLDQVFKETLRMHPPIHTVMRLVEKDMQTPDGLTIPQGHFLCSGITVGHYEASKFADPLVFRPERHALSAEESGEWTINGVDVAQKSARNHYLPFGAGRHRCIGEHFATIQNKTIVATIINEFDLELVDGHVPKSDFSKLIVLPVAGSQIRLKRRVFEKTEE
ncbi:MAG: hypothetical protein SGCHY_004769 [Lobulomycetales sp.]